MVSGNAGKPEGGAVSQLLLINPKKRARKVAKKRKHAKRRTHAKKSKGMASSITTRVRYARNPKRKKYRRNPRHVGGIVKQATSALMPAVIAAGGAVGVDIALGYLPLPDNLKTGMLRHVTRAAAAVALGVAAGYVVKPETARQIMSGGLTVTFYGAMRELIANNAPQIKMAAIDDDDLGAMSQELNALLADEQMKALVADSSGGIAGMGDFSPAFAGMGNSGFDDSEYNN